MDLVARFTAAVEAPVNVMATPDGPDRAAYARVGVARMSHGPYPYRRMIAAFEADVAGSVKV